MNIVILLAGGVGTRMGQAIPKQFICVNDKPIIVYTLLSLQKHKEIDAIQAVCVNGWEKVLSDYAIKFNITKLQGVISGGKSRYESIRAGIDALGKLDDNDVVIVHDAVRPLVSAYSITDTIRVCKMYGNAMTTVMCTDTMYIKDNDICTSCTFDRERLICGQTPEGILAKYIHDMYIKADARNIQNDSISALQNAIGWKIYFAKGEKSNIKLTTGEDIDLFKALLALKQKGE